MIQIDMPIPDSCSECRFETERGFCKAMSDNFCGYTKDEGRPEWCPLKEQEPITARKEHDEDDCWWACGKCGEEINWKDKFCKYCGHEVKWE